MLPFDSESGCWFAQHLQPHEPMLRAWLHSRYPTGVDVDDIVQEAYLRVLQARAASPVRSPKAFLFATARNLALDQVRRGQVVRFEPLVETDSWAVLDEGEGIPETIAHNQELETLTEAIQSLPDRCRQIFTLRKVYGMPQAEIAKKLGVSTHTVSAQLTIGLNKCNEFMHRRRAKETS